MAKAKITIARIANDVARRNAFRKRSASMMKKLSQLCTLCNVEGCLVIFQAAAGLYRRIINCKENSMMVWPSNEAARQILTDFKALTELQRNKKMKQQHMFLQEKAAKLLKQARGLDRLNRDYAISLLLLHALDQIHTGASPPPPPPPPPAYAPLSMDEATMKLAYFTLANQKNPQDTITFMASVIIRMGDPSDIQSLDEVVAPAEDLSAQAQGQDSLEISPLPLQRRDQVAAAAAPWCDHHHQSVMLGPREASDNNGGPEVVAATLASMKMNIGPWANFQ